MLVPSLAQGMGGNYEKPSDPSYLHGKTCAEVMTKLFKHAMAMAYDTIPFDGIGHQDSLIATKAGQVFEAVGRFLDGEVTP